MSTVIKYYNIYQLTTHLKLGSNVAAKNILQVYLTRGTVGVNRSQGVINDLQNDRC